MREHQIVISLKPEQFEEVQRLARAAGVRSVSTFVRQRLLSLLGVNAGELKVQPESAQDTDLSEISEELQRMQRELQVFIAESLSQGAYWGGEPLDLSATLPVQDDWYPDMAGAPADDQWGDEELPPPRPLPESPWSRLTQSWSSQVPGAVQPSASIADPALLKQGEPETPLADTVPPYQEPQPPLDIFAPDKSRIVQTAKADVWRSSTQPPESLAKLLEGFGESKDELENLAERAFAISPRLGAMDPNYRLPAQDPLADLLPEATQQAQADASVAHAHLEQMEQAAGSVDQQPLSGNAQTQNDPNIGDSESYRGPAAFSGGTPTEVIPTPIISPVRSLHAPSFLPEPTPDDSLYIQDVPQQSTQSGLAAGDPTVPADESDFRSSSSSNSQDYSQTPTGAASPTRPRPITPDSDKGPMEGSSGVSGGPPPKKRQT